VAALTYPEVGATLDPSLPAGYHHLDARRRVTASLDDLGAFILGWGLHRGAGLSVPDAPVAADATYRLRLGPVPVPVQVVRVLDEPDRRGFVYGTLPGHPEVGEEAFLAERDAEGTWVHVRAFSRPGTWYARLGGPAGRLAQRMITERYLRAAERL
jgi:uncharacterized protein (UPF0548 family)